MILESKDNSVEMAENDDSDSDIEVLEEISVPKQVANSTKDSGYDSDSINSPMKPEDSSNEASEDEEDDEDHCKECGQILKNVSFYSFNGGINEKEALQYFLTESTPSLKVANASVFDSVGHLVNFKRVSLPQLDLQYPKSRQFFLKLLEHLNIPNVIQTFQFW